MNIGSLAKRAGKLASDNAPTILTAIGVTGAITTAVLAGKASFKAAEIIGKIERERLEDDEIMRDLLPLNEKVKLVWPHYVPAVGTGVLTIAAIVTANRISTRRAAALASAYTVSQQYFKEYKDKVVEHIGKDKEQKVRDAVTKDLANRKPPPPQNIIVGGKECMVYDQYTNLWFKSSYDDLKQAEIDINFQIINDGYASVSDLWRRLGATHGAIAEEIGWNTDKKLELDIGSIIHDGVPILTLDFRTVPVRGYGSSY